MCGDQVFDLFGKAVFCGHTVNFLLKRGAQVKTFVGAIVGAMRIYEMATGKGFHELFKRKKD